MLQRELLIDSIIVPLCLHIYAPDAHMQSVLMYRSHVCVSIDKICDWNMWQGYKNPHTLGQGGSGCCIKRPSQCWSMDVSGCVTLDPSLGLILIPTHGLHPSLDKGRRGGGIQSFHM